MQDTTTATRPAATQPEWSSYTDADATLTAEIFGAAADLIAKVGHDGYADENYEGRGAAVSIRQALTAAARVRMVRLCFGVEPTQPEVETLVEELELRLVGLLYLTGRAVGKPMGDMSNVLCHFEKDAVTWRRQGGRDRGIYHQTGDVVAFLRLASGAVALTIRPREL